MLETFLEYMRAVKGLSSSTIESYRYDLTAFFEHLGGGHPTFAVLSSITIEDLHRYFAVLEARGDSAATRARKVASLKAFYRYMTLTLRLFNKNPVLELEAPKIGTRVPKFLSLEECHTLLDATKEDARANAIIVVFLNCGLRLSELVGMNLADVKEGAVRIVGKGNRERIVPLNDEAKKAIRKYLKVRSKVKTTDTALFLSNRKTRIANRTLQDLIKGCLDEAGLLGYSTHKLRHTAATLMHKYGKVDIRTLQEFLGHASISTTEIYTHVDNEQLREAVESNPLSKRRK